VPVLGHGGRVVAAMSVAGRCGEIDTRRLSTDARRVAAAASQAWVMRGARAHSRQLAY